MVFTSLIASMATLALNSEPNVLLLFCATHDPLLDFHFKKLILLLSRVKDFGFDNL